MRGRKPNLPPLVAIEGDRGKCPSPPGWLNTHAKAEWRRAAPELFGRNLLTPDTLAMLESYCVASGVVRETEEIMAREGRLVETDKGTAPHPAFRMQGSAMREARLLAGELGLSPHRKGATGKTEGKSNDEWDADLLA